MNVVPIAAGAQRVIHYSFHNNVLRRIERACGSGANRPAPATTGRRTSACVPPHSGSDAPLPVRFPRSSFDRPDSGNNPAPG